MFNSRIVSLLAGALLGPSMFAGTPDAKRFLDAQPLRFEANGGQLAREVLFRSLWSDYPVELVRDGIVVRTGAGKEAVRIHLKGAGAQARAEGSELLSARGSYFLGNRKSDWRTGIAQYRKVRYSEVWPGIDVVFHGAGRSLEFDFVVRPGADPNRIRLAFEGTDGVREDGGALVLKEDADLRLHVPVVYQEDGGRRSKVEGRYSLLSRHEAGFVVGEYDPARELVIDPVLGYSTYLGVGTPEVARAVGVDPSGRVWAAITAASNTLPIAGDPVRGTNQGKKDVFLVCFDPSKSGDDSLVYSTYIGGTGDDEARALAIDSLGQVYVAGITNSADFPLAGPSARKGFGGSYDSFVIRLNPAGAGGAALEFSTYFGGSKDDWVQGLALDRFGSIYMSGTTNSDDLPLSSPATQPNRRGGYDAWVTKISPFLDSSLVYSTYLGGGSSDFGTAVAPAPDGNTVYFAGYTYSGDFPISGPAFQSTLKGADGFIAKVDVTKSGLDALVYVSYIGGSGLDVPQAMALDAKGGVVLAGYTLSADFPVTARAFQSQPAGMADVFVSRLDVTLPPLEQVTFSSYLGGSQTDILQGMALDSAGHVFLSGYTFSNDFPARGALQDVFGGQVDGFLTEFDLSGTIESSVVYSTYLGGSGQDVPYGLAVDAKGVAYVSGITDSTNYPVSGGAKQTVTGGAGDAFVSQISPQ
ncbi:MAG: hypothetical protein IANPNBLG_03742 [Bryobacteraceae bacterium]|nr:hypothetical protein [Bryobacteraceae bacterium]